MVNKIFKLIVLISIFLFIVSASIAIPNKVPAHNNKGNVDVIIPAHAVELADGVFSLGTAADIDGKIVEGFAFVDYLKVDGKEQNAKPGTICGNDMCEPGENAKKCPADCGGGSVDPPDSTCYSFTSKGAKWKSQENYIVDPTTNDLTSNFVKNTIAADIQKWEDAASQNIFGNEVAGLVDGADTINPDGKNEVLFGDINSPGAIAVTIVWGIFRGPPSGRELVEWDQVYDDVDYNWSEDCLSNDCTSKMDFDNIVNHEIGHSFGISHPGSECTEETMYAFASFNETKKRSLFTGDIAGIIDLYS